MDMTASFQNMVHTLAKGLNTHNQAIVVAPPGTGKTTKIPSFLLESMAIDEGQIVVLEPRRVAARASASFIAKQKGEKPGGTIGYELRLDRKISRDTRINFQTEGLFLKRMIADPELSGVSVLIFDEFHERSLNADLCLALALDIQSAIRPDLKIIIMSATLDVSPLGALLPKALYVHCDAPHYPIEDRYTGRSSDRNIEDQVVRIVERSLNVDQGSILAFLPGQREISRCHQRLVDREVGQNAEIFSLHGQLDGHVQDRAIAPAAPGARKIVLSTAIAQTSITIEGVSVVVDSGLSRQARYEAKTGLSRLVTEKSSLATAEQRRGRAGRTGPGVCYRLWDQEQNRALKQYDEPEIRNADLTSLALVLADWGVVDVNDLKWIDPPPAVSLARAQSLLRQLEALDADGRITSIGKAMVKMPLHPRLSHMILKAAEFGQTQQAAYLAAMLSEQGGNGKEIDLEHRFGRFLTAKDMRIRALKKQAEGWIRDLPSRPSSVSKMKMPLGALLSLGFPDRVAKSRPGRPGYFTLVNGRGAYIEPHEALAKQAFLCVFELGGHKQDSRIFSATALRAQDIEILFGSIIQEAISLSVDISSGQLRCLKQRRLGGVVLSERPAEAPLDEAVGAFLAFLRSEGLEHLPWTPATLGWLERVRFLIGQGEGGDYEALSETALLETLDMWCSSLLNGIQSLSHIPAAALDGAIKSLIPWNMVQRIDELAPTHFTAPTGSRHRIDYGAEGGPIVSLRVQECFGLKDHPRLGRKGLALRLALLSPAHRPIQITTDLPGFWSGSYAQVRSEMRGRYPKHPWPEDPASAEPTKRAKPRKA